MTERDNESVFVCVLVSRFLGVFFGCAAGKPESVCACVCVRVCKDQGKAVSCFFPYFQFVGLFMWTFCASVISLLSFFIVLRTIYVLYGGAINLHSLMHSH